MTGETFPILEPADDGFKLFRETENADGSNEKTLIHEFSRDELLILRQDIEWVVTHNVSAAVIPQSETKEKVKTAVREA